MLSEAQKDFRTITLRGLEDKPEIVAIMNETMHQHGLKTGQSVIEHIVNSYPGLLEKVASLHQEVKLQRQKYRDYEETTTTEIDDLKHKLKVIKRGFSMIETIEF